MKTSFRIPLFTLLALFISHFFGCSTSKRLSYPYNHFSGFDRFPSKNYPYQFADKSLLGLTGNVKSYKEIDYKPIDNFGNIERGEIIKTHDYYGYSLHSQSLVDQRIVRREYKFDDKGRLTERKWFNSKGRLMFESKVVYDKKGRLTESKHQSNIRPMKFFNKHETYEYCENGNLVEVKNYSANERLDYRITYIHDKLEKTVDGSSNMLNGYFIFKRKYSCEASGNRFEEKSYTADGAMVMKTTNVFDGLGKLTEFIVHNSNDSLIYKQFYIYNELDQIVENRVYHTNYGLAYKLSFTYDDFGNMIKRNMYRDDRIRIYSTIFDEQSKITAYIHYGLDGVFSGRNIYEHEYDEHGNWIKRIQYAYEHPNNTPTVLTIREIQYYDE